METNKKIIYIKPMELPEEDRILITRALAWYKINARNENKFKRARDLLDLIRNSVKIVIY